MLYISKAISRGYALFLALFLSSQFSASSPIERREPNCHEIIIPVTITARNVVLPEGLTLNLFGLIAVLLDSVFTTTIQGTYDIAGRYCEPEVVVSSRTNALQILSHPATYDRNFWSGGGYPGLGYDGDRYDWVSWASQQGYPTLAFDRLGNGNSSHPDPITVAQCPAQAETIHEMIKLARAGKPPFPRAFDKIIYTGASLGAIVGNIININHPDDIDATIHAGFSKVWVNAVPGFILTAELLPAAEVEPERYGSLPDGYLEADSESGIAFLLFYGPGEYYDETFVASDYRKRGIISVGEGVTGALGIGTATEYKGSVLVITGQQDVPFCGTTGLEISGPGNCGRGPSSILEQTSTLYPAAQNYTAIHVENSGHVWMHQYSAQWGFKAVHTWLAERGF